MIGKVCILGTKQAKQGIGKQVGLFLMESGGVTLPGNVCKFYPYLSLETVFAARKPTQNSYINVNFLFLKIGNLIINWVPISLLPTYCA